MDSAQREAIRARWIVDRTSPSQRRAQTDIRALLEDADAREARIAHLEAALREIDSKFSLTPYGIGGPSTQEIAAVVVSVKEIAREALESEGE